MLLVVAPGFSSVGSLSTVATEVRHVSTKLVPSDSKFGLRVSGETSNITTSIGYTTKGKGKQLRNGDLQIFPSGISVTSPDSSPLLRSGIERTTQDVRSCVLFGITLDQTVISSLMLGVTIDVVDFTMFNLEGGSGVGNRLEGLKVVSWHVVAWLFKDRRLVHVIPSPDVFSGGLVLIKTVLRSPAVSGFFIKEIKIDTSTRPASSNEVLVILSLDTKVLFNSLLVNPVFIISLDVGIGNSNKLTTISLKSSVHGWDIRVVLLVESEVSATISVVNVQSDTVTRDFVLVEVLVDTKGISLIFV